MNIGESIILRRFHKVPCLNIYSMLTRGLFLPDDVIASFTLQALHNVVIIAKFPVIETSSTLTFLGDFLVSIDQLLDSKELLEEFLFHFPRPEVVL